MIFQQFLSFFKSSIDVALDAKQFFLCLEYNLTFIQKKVIMWQIY